MFGLPAVDTYHYAKCPNPIPSSSSRTITFSPRFTDSSAATPITTLQKPSSAVAAVLLTYSLLKLFEAYPALRLLGAETMLRAFPNWGSL